MDSVKQIDEQAIAVKAEQDSTGSLGVWRSCQRELEGLALQRIRIRARVDREVGALYWIGHRASIDAKEQEKLAAARFEAVKSGDGVAILLGQLKFKRGY